MTKFTPLKIGLSLPALLLSQAAWADVTAADVWGDWKQYMETMGYTVSATEAANGDNLTVSDINVTLPMPENAGNVSMSMGTLNFEQNGGAVNIVMPDVMPFTINAGPDGSSGGEFVMNFEYTQTGQSLMASGTPEQITYDYTADSFSMVLAQLQVEGDTFGPDNAKVNLTGSGVATSTTMTKGAMRDYVQSGTIASLVYDIAIDNPEEPVKFNMSGNLDEMSFDGTSAIPLNALNSSDMAAMLKAGFALKGQFGYSAGATQIDVQDPSSGNFAMTSSSQGGGLAVEMNAQKIAYSGEQNTIALNVQSAQLPFPVEMSMARSGFNLDMPISKSDDPQGFDFGITVGDFVMSDLLWSIFDPTAQLPRDPATIELDLNGQAKVLVDVMDPMAAASVDAPAELNAITVNKLLVSAAGAKVEGTGDFTFDNSDMSTFPGMPKPVGSVDLAVAGANGLMDKLVAMGLLPEEQAMGARMMMGLFAVPGSEPDTLSSKVEFTQDGQVLANGQRIK